MKAKYYLQLEVLINDLWMFHDKCCMINTLCKKKMFGNFLIISKSKNLLEMYLILLTFNINNYLYCFKNKLRTFDRVMLKTKKNFGV